MSYVILCRNVSDVNSRFRPILHYRVKKSDNSFHLSVLSFRDYPSALYYMLSLKELDYNNSFVYKIKEF